MRSVLRGGIHRTTTLADLADRHGWMLHRAHPGEPVNGSALVYADGAPIEFTTALPAELGATVVLEVPFGRAAGHDAWPIAKGGVLLRDATFISARRELRAYERLGSSSSQRRLRGRAALLASTFSSGNYGHALLDSLGRLAILERAGIDAASLDHVIVPSFRSPTLDRILHNSGVSEDRTIRLGLRDHVVADRLLVTSLPGAPRVYPSWLAPWMRERLGAVERPGRRLFLGRRGGHRQLNNASDLEPVLRRFGFEEYDPTGADATADDVAWAAAVAGPHGAGMSDIVFCAPGTPVVEIIPSGHRYPYFASLAVASGMRYVAVRGASVSSERNAPFTVVPDEFEAALRVATGD